MRQSDGALVVAGSDAFDYDFEGFMVARLVPDLAIHGAVAHADRTGRSPGTSDRDLDRSSTFIHFNPAACQTEQARMRSLLRPPTRQPRPYAAPIGQRGCRRDRRAPVGRPRPFARVHTSVATLIR